MSAPSLPAAADASTPPPAAASAPAPPTPLEQRQWRRGAQTAVRVALTATKSARSRAAEASAAGTRAVTDLTNALLEARYLPSRPLGPVAESAPGLVAAAVQKLERRAAAALERLDGCCGELEAAAQDIRDAAACVAAELTDPRWQRRAPVFHTIPLPAASDLLARIAEAHAREAAAKRSMVEALRRHPALCGAPPTADGGSGAGGPGSSKGSGGGSRGTAGEGSGREWDLEPEKLRERLTVAIAAWLSQPGIDDEASDLALGALTEDMAGF